MTPINNTTNLNGSACSINQNATIKATANKIVPIVNQSLFPHHKVSKKHTPKTIEATFDATISKPQKMRSAPMREEPR